MQFKLAVSTAMALLIVTGASRGWADKGKAAKKEIGTDATINKQFEWENRVVGPKEGLDKDRLAAIQEKGRREEEARKKEPPKKQERAAGVSEAGSASLPTMDIEKPAPAGAKKPAAKKVAAAEQPRQKDALDNLLNEQGVKPYNPGRTSTSDEGLGSVFASDGAGSGSSTKKTAGKKPRRK
jgi:hypothetical protein